MLLSMPVPRASCYLFAYALGLHYDHVVKYYHKSADAISWILLRCSITWGLGAGGFDLFGCSVVRASCHAVFVIFSR